MEKKRNSFTGSLGFVLAAAGSAVGLGNIWRFPYLAARDGGGLFLVVYFVLVLTFGFTLLLIEVAIGRKTKQSVLTAYGTMTKRAKPLGFISCLVPMLVLPYYCVVGGWVVKYFLAFLTGSGFSAAEDGYFTDFITEISTPMIMMIVFLFLTIVVVLAGVNKGIERFSKIMMPILLVLITFIAIFSLTMSYTDADGTVRTGLQGLKILLIPDAEAFQFKNVATTVIDAMGQLFYSLSVASGIMITYGSYMPDETNLSSAIGRIEIFDTVVALLAGVMIIPAVYVFMGREGIEASGPGLMFISLPKVFAEMGGIGNLVGCLFFAMVLFAAITSSVSLLEGIVSSYMDHFHVERKKAVLFGGLPALAVGIIVCLGYNLFYFELKLPNGATGQLLELLDYVSNYVLMPIVAICACFLIGWIVKPKYIIDEVTKNGEKFHRKWLFIIMVKFVAPILLLLLLLRAFGIG